MIATVQFYLDWLDSKRLNANMEQMLIRFNGGNPVKLGNVLWRWFHGGGGWKWSVGLFLGLFLERNK